MRVPKLWIAWTFVTTVAAVVTVGFIAAISAQPTHADSIVGGGPAANEPERPGKGLSASEPGLPPGVIKPASLRFLEAEGAEQPDFQRHVLPLMGRLGCNGRACHGSFQGRGGLRLSLFGYDFQTDHDTLLAKGTNRVNTDDPEGSKVLQKPTLLMPHKGGKCLDVGSWSYHLLARWIDAGAPLRSKSPANENKQGQDKDATEISESPHFVRLEVLPGEIIFQRPGESRQLRVIAHWSDGAREDVTCLSRFRTNDDSIADVDENGKVTAKGKGDSHIVAFYDNGVTPVSVLMPVNAQNGDKYPNVSAGTKIDELVIEKLRKLGIVPSELCTDGEFLRRVSLDLTGTLPTAPEVTAFLKDGRPDKRGRKIDELLGRPAYAAYWATRLCDITGNNDRQLQNTPLPAEFTADWYRWIEHRVQTNMPYDELVAGIVMAKSRKPGQSYEDFVKEQSAYYRKGADGKPEVDFATNPQMPYFWLRRNIAKPEDKALAFSYAFLGVRLECAQCHKHPFDQWTQQDFQQFTEFFKTIRSARGGEYNKHLEKIREELKLDPKKNNNQIRQDLVKYLQSGHDIPWEEVTAVAPPARRANKAKDKNKDKNKKNAASARVVTPKLLGDEEIDLSQEDDPRAPLMAWLRKGDNPYFARAFVNRAWASYFGVGITQPADDMNLANPPSNQKLIDYLVQGFVDHKFDMKWVHREILNSDTYQRSWKTNPTNTLDERNFSRSLVRRLPAEVVMDAVTQATARTEIAARFPFDITERAIGAKGNLRGVREGYAATVFGQPKRDTNCDCSRSNDPNLLQAIYLQNDERDVLSRLDRRDGWLAELAGVTLEEQNADKAKNAKAGKPGKPDKPAGADRDLGAQLDQIQARYVKIKVKNPEQAKKLLERITQLKKQLAAQAAAAENGKTEVQAKGGKNRKKNAAAEADAAVAAKLEQANHLTLRNPDAVIRAAYLRALSRPPSDEDLKIARAYLKDSAKPADGLRDLLWAIINTKEFITNH